MNFKAYSLLYIAEDKKNATNFSSVDKLSHLNTYILNASTLSSSLKLYNIDFILITNNKRLIEEKFVELSIDAVNVIEIPFDLDVPSDVNFYSAHFKLDVFKYFSLLPNESYVALLDLDMISMSPPSSVFLSAIESKKAMYYEITDQVITAYGNEVILSDLKKINSKIVSVKWFGGEFISGTPSFFLDLMKEIDWIYPIYCSKYKELHHQGDEMVTTVALMSMSSSFDRFIDAGEILALSRYWSARTKHKQISMRKAFKMFLVHLPSDKSFLAEMAHENKFWYSFVLKKYIYYRVVNLMNKLIYKTFNIKF